MEKSAARPGSDCANGAQGSRTPRTGKPRNVNPSASPTDRHWTQRVRFVLSRPSHPGNIGASARAIRTMGFTRLALVAPRAFPHPEATALAAGAADVLDAAMCRAELREAVADCRFVLGATARRRGVSIRELTPRAAAAFVEQSAIRGDEVAIVFGNERAGLENEELALCHAAVTIPSDPACPSLNLAQAVQVVAYELGLRGVDMPAPPSPADPAATSAQVEQMFTHLAQTLEDIDFHKGRSPRTILQRLRRLFLRARPDPRELRILHGIFADVQRTARIARGDASAVPARPDRN
jgi:tRNA (cytidine32/uridine32-2'-O)-methyltransferase